MSNLAQNKCVPCERDIPALTKDEIQSLKKETPEWEVVEVDGIPWLKRSFSFNFIISIILSLVLISCTGTNKTSFQTETPAPRLTHTTPASTHTRPAPTNTATLQCPSYGRPYEMLNIANNRGKNAEPMLLTGDFNTDGLDDLLVAWSIWGEYETFKFDILLNDGNENLISGTSELFSGEIPEIQSLPALPLLVSDFNSDGHNDVFLGIAGLDTEPFPGYQNLLLLSDTNGKLIDATLNLPQQNDFPHSVASADVDNDGDVDVYVGNVWSQPMVDPQLLLNDSKGIFNNANYLLPPHLTLQQNGYTASEFVDVNNDSFPDLVLGDAGDDISNNYSSRDSIVLINDGSGGFTLLEGAIPQKQSPTWLAEDIVSSDLNGDNYQDLVIVYTETNFVGRFFQVLINQRDGTFLDETEQRLPNANDTNSAAVYQLDFLDMDMDQDMDLIVRLWNDKNPTPLLYMNDGEGFFVSEQLNIGLDSVHYTILDIDGDGGNDFVYAYYGPSSSVFLIKENGCK